MSKKTEVLTGLKKIVATAKGIKPKVETIAKVSKAIKKTSEIASTETVSEVISEVAPEQIASTETVSEVISEVAPEQIASTETVSEVISEIAPEQIASTETTTANSPSLFDMFQAPTEEDSKKDNVSHLEHIAESITDDDLKDEDLNLDEDSLMMRREMADVKATAMVEFGELIIALLCMWIADDWSIASQEQKFIISTKKKKAIKISIMKIIIARKKKTNPTLSIILLCVGSAVPMLVMAIVTRIQKKRDMKAQNELIQKERALILERNKQVTQSYVSAMEENEKTHTQNVQAILENAPEKIVPISKNKNLTVIKKETRGRHKKECASHKGKKCNCKG